MRKLRLGFSPYGLLIVSLQALPNIVWALWPPIPDALNGNASSVPFVEYGEHVLGVAIVVMLLFLVGERARGGWAAGGFAGIALYWLCWALYYAGIQPNPVIYAMVILPPAAFFCAGMAERVWPVAAASALFLAFHLTVALENFPVMGMIP
ncbi:MAG: hypothetical protein LBK41_03230 [Clostridiales bacterium]|nr:hypothetical protein [Clostridiales bacterium]